MQLDGERVMRGWGFIWHRAFKNIWVADRNYRATLFVDKAVGGASFGEALILTAKKHISHLN
jgi:hypothetical protein